MDEIFSLQKRLMEVQSNAPKKMLSERNAIDLLEFLKTSAGLEIVSSQDGKEFFTPKALDDMVSDLMCSAKKMRIAEASSTLLVNLELIEARIGSLTKNYGIIHLNGSMITKDYIQSLFEEIDEQLKTLKVCQINSISFKNEIETSFLVALLNDSKYNHLISTSHRIDFKTNTIFSEKYDSSMKARLRGLITGFKCPISVDEISNTLSISTSQLSQYAHELEIGMENSMLVSAAFAKDRKDNISNFFSKNGSIEYEYLKKHFYLTKPKEFLASIYPDKKEIVYLTKIAISQVELMKIIVGCEQSIKCDGFANIENFINFQLEHADIPTIVSFVNAELDVKGMTIEFDSCCLLSNKQCMVFKTKIENEIIRANISLSSVTVSKIKQLLIDAKMLDYQTDDVLLEFISKCVFEKLDKTKLKKDSTTKLEKKVSEKKPQVIKNTTNLMKLKIPQLLDRLTEIINYYLLAEKNLRSLLNSKAVEEEQNLLSQLEKIKKSVIQNIVFVILRKFSHVFADSILNDFEKPNSPSEILVPPFQDEIIFFKHWKSVTQDIRQVFESEVSKGEASVLKDIQKLEYEQFAQIEFDLVRILNKKGTQITLGNFDVNLNKKSEKSFLQTQLLAFKEHIEGNYLKEDAMELFSMILNCVCIKKGYLFFWKTDKQLISDLITLLKASGEEILMDLAEELDQNLTEFEIANENKDDTITFFEDQIQKLF